MSLPDWLDFYASSAHDWHHRTQNGKPTYWRRQGFVEGAFDTDGTDFEGRADLTMKLDIEIRTSLSTNELRNRILLAWSILRQKHVLMSCKAISARDFGHELQGVDAEERLFVFEPATKIDEAQQRGSETIVFVEDHYPDLNRDDFYLHMMNTKRCINPEKELIKMYVLPIPKQQRDGSFMLHMVLVIAHQIIDGITSFRWTNSFIDLLNLPQEKLLSYATRLLSQSLIDRLPPAQETLYPKPSGNVARQRWSWLLSRIIRHVRQAPPASFQNPLRRETPLTKAQAFPSKYSAILDYSSVPPLYGYVVHADLGRSSVRRLAQLCRSSGISLGSGGFVIVAMVMMKFEEQRHPGIPLEQRLPFVGSFPVNPRPFLSGKPTTGKEDSLMLAFSEGITLPFLPSELDFEKRFRLLGRLAHRQLRQYQKRKRSIQDELELGSKGSKFFLPGLYLSTLERLEGKRRPEQKRGWNIQGEYPAKVGPTLATCGVSSVGDRSGLIRPGKYDVSKLDEGVDLVADFRNQQSAVRPRDGEFLVGSAGDKDSLGFGVSYDGCAIDPEKAQEWRYAIESLLEPQPQQMVARYIKL